MEETLIKTLITSANFFAFSAIALIIVLGSMVAFAANFIKQIKENTSTQLIISSNIPSENEEKSTHIHYHDDSRYRREPECYHYKNLRGGDRCP